MLSIDNISFSYGENRVFENFTLSVGEGERICLFGADIVEKKAEIHAHIFREQMRKTVLCVMKFFRTGLQGDILRIIFNSQLS